MWYTPNDPLIPRLGADHMIATNLQSIADRVIRRAKRQGYVVSSDIRDELSQAGLPDTLWKDVAALARPSLAYRRGRYYFEAPVSTRVRQEQARQRDIQKAVRQIIRRQRADADRVERRGQDRIDFVQPVKVVTDDEREFTLLSRDLSTSGIRLVGTRGLLGQKVRVLIPRDDQKAPWSFRVRILWTCTIGDDLVENGGTFLEVSDDAS
jgi:hypothetical protein